MKVWKNLSVLVLVGLLSSCTMYAKGLSYVKHHKGNNWNEGFNNRAVSLEFVDTSIPHFEKGVGLAYNKNSYYKDAFNAHLTSRACTEQSINLCTGLLVGATTGYQEQTDLWLTPAAMWINRATYGNWGIEHGRVPSWHGFVGFDTLMMLYKKEFNYE